MKAITLLLIDEHLLFREGMRALVSRQPDLVVASEAANMRDGMARALQERPDVVVTDLISPPLDGVDAIRMLCREYAEARVLVLTMYASEHLAAQSLLVGALGYTLKDQPPEEVFSAVRAVARGERYLAPVLARQAVEELMLEGSCGVLGVLSQREREVFTLVARGLTNEGIASVLFISVKTVETHRARINKKLDLHSSAELIRFAARHGLIRV